MRRWCAAILSALAIGVVAQSASADPPASPMEAPVKAAVLLNLTRFVQWPDSVVDRDRAPLMLLIIGSDPVAAELDAQADSLARRRGLALEHGRDPRLLGQANVLYIAGSERANLAALLRTIGDRPVLTVSDLPGFAHAGGICSFHRKGATVGLEINLERARRAGLRISSKVLALATIVED